MEFNDELISGIDEIDDQHKKIIDLVNEIDKSCNGFIDKNHLISLIDSLEFYSNGHFDLEEKYAQKYNFEKYDDLKNEHNFFRNIYKEIRYSADMTKDTTDTNIQLQSIYIMRLAAVLESWIKKHVYTLDKELIALIKKNQ